MGYAIAWNPLANSIIMACGKKSLPINQPGNRYTADIYQLTLPDYTQYFPTDAPTTAPSPSPSLPSEFLTDAPTTAPSLSPSLPSEQPTTATPTLATMMPTLSDPTTTLNPTAFPTPIQIVRNTGAAIECDYN
eukprot:1138443_1